METITREILEECGLDISDNSHDVNRKLFGYTGGLFLILIAMFTIVRYVFRLSFFYKIIYPHSTWLYFLLYAVFVAVFNKAIVYDGLLKKKVVMYKTAKWKFYSTNCIPEGYVRVLTGKDAVDFTLKFLLPVIILDFVAVSWIVWGLILND